MEDLAGGLTHCSDEGGYDSDEGVKIKIVS
jgi:hypothetical protein